MNFIFIWFFLLHILFYLYCYYIIYTLQPYNYPIYFHDNLIIQSNYSYNIFHLLSYNVSSNISHSLFIILSYLSSLHPLFQIIYSYSLLISNHSIIHFHILPTHLFLLNNSIHIIIPYFIINLSSSFLSLYSYSHLFYSLILHQLYYDYISQ